jgi:hypothetical protein
MAKLTQKKLDCLIRKWQKILKLLDWTIKSNVLRGHEMNGNEGLCAVTFSRRMAFISIEDPNDSSTAKEWGTDPEHVVVHELLHCYFHPFFPEDRDSVEYDLAEQAVDGIAGAFIALDRAKKS